MFFRVSKRMLSSKVRSTTASGSTVYESERAVQEYLLTHYGRPNQLLPFPGPIEATNFPMRCAEICKRYSSNTEAALDLGCAVGGQSFALSKYFDSVLGIDFSNHFVRAANQMKEKGSVQFEAQKQGDISETMIAEIPKDSNPERITFVHGDACNLNPSIGLYTSKYYQYIFAIIIIMILLGKFDLILGANLLCRLPSPRQFVKSVPSFLNKDGIVVIITPYSWLEEYTPKEEWFGGHMDENNQPVDSFSALQQFIKINCPTLSLIHTENVPFLIREHERKFQYGVSHCSIWKNA